MGRGCCGDLGGGLVVGVGGEKEVGIMVYLCLCFVVVFVFGCCGRWNLSVAIMGVTRASYKQGGGRGIQAAAAERKRSGKRVEWGSTIQRNTT